MGETLKQQHVFVLKRHTILSVAIAAALAGFSPAATLTWDGNDATAGGTVGGAGTWDSGTTANWTNTGGNEQTWTDTAGTDIATFSGTIGTVSIVSGGVTANQLLFTVGTGTAGTSYTIGSFTGGGGITLAGTTPTIAVGSTQNSLLLAPITANNLTITGNSGSSLLLDDNNNVTGVTTINMNGGTIGVVPGNAAKNTVSPTANPFGTSTVKVVSNLAINYRDSGNDTHTAQNLNYGNNFELATVNTTLSLNLGPVSGDGNSQNKTYVFGSLNYDTSATVSPVGSITTNAPFYNLTFTGINIGGTNTVATFYNSASAGRTTIGSVAEVTAGSNASFVVGQKNGAGSTLTINGAANYSGATSILSGAVFENANNALNSNSTLTVGGLTSLSGSPSSGTLDLNGHTQAFTGLLSTNGEALATVTSSATSATGASLVINGPVASTFNGVITDGGTAKSLNLTVNGGTLTLGATNTYNGTTTINTGGNLALGAAGALTKTPTINLNGGGFDTSANSTFAIGAAQTLSGQGTVNVNAAGLAVNGKLSVGQTGSTTPQVLTVTGGGVTLAGTMTLHLDTFTAGSTGTSDSLVAPTLTYGGTLAITNATGVNSNTFTTGSAWQLFSGTGTGTFANSFAFNDANLPMLASGLSWNFNAGTGVLSVVPEPASLGILAMGGSVLLRRRKQK